ncbi:DNA polymerase [Acetobacterium carbinolicum]|uniref:DNA polymerase n=1 Tax=Acetobacterium carbinolicum TaxID=52690 RepID=UPI0039C92451
MEDIKTLSLDLETYSDVDLGKCGVYRYAESPNFEILLFGYAINGGEVYVIDLALGEKIPDDILNALTDNNIIKWAFNASFERVCLSYWLKKHYPYKFRSYSIPEDTVGAYLDPSSWRCSMVWSAYMGLPLSLEGVGTVLKLDEQKLKEGKDLIRYFCIPCKPSSVNGGRTRNLPTHDLSKWLLFKNYNIRDIVVEQAVKKRLESYPVPEFVWDEYHLDQEINDRGILLDMGVVKNAIIFDEKSREELTTAMKRLTNLENPNSVQQLKQWLSDHGVETESLDKKNVAALIKTVPEDQRDMLLLRQQLAKSSVKKYQTMHNTICLDGRARGMFFFYGASRSGRWAGRHIQLHNLPQNHIPDLADARSLVKLGDYDAVKLLYEDVPDTLSQLIRTAFIPRPGYKFIVSDFSAIEARILSFLAGEKWRLDVFENDGDIYCASASAMFHVPVEKHGLNSHLRQKGKIAELALGYGGNMGALKALNAVEMGLSEQELKPLVDSWRSSNPNITKLWWDVDRAIKEAVRLRTHTKTHGIRFYYQKGILFIELPSGRKLSYVKPKIEPNRFGGESVTYEGTGVNKKWGRIESYGPKFTENIIQAISRDILAYAMKTLRHCFICGHVHDEIIFECSKDISLKVICDQMGKTPPWIKGLTLRADGFETTFYKKD